MSATEDRLRRALAERADRVRTDPDALSTIRRRVRGRTRHRRGLVAGLAALGTATVAGVTAAVLGLGAAGPATVPTGTASVPGVTTTGGPTASTTSAGPPIGVSEPIYLVGAGDQLFREWHTLAVSRAGGVDVAADIRAALTDMMSARPLDPDYHTLWPAGASVRGVQLVGTQAVVDLSVPATAPTDPAAALQQLIYTATAVANNDKGPAVSSVLLRVDGQPTNRLWGVDVSTALSRGPVVEVAAPVWLSSPQEGAVVSSPLTVQIVGTAAVPEAAVVLRVERPDGSEVLTRPLTLDAGSALQRPVQATLTLAPGSYHLLAYFVSLKDGSVQAVDDHTITVR